MNATSIRVGRKSYAEVRACLLARTEIALLDVREEDPHAQSHPLFAAHFPLSRIEVDAYTRLPRRDVAVVVLDDGEGLAGMAAARLIELGYVDVAILDGGVAGWAAAGGELFRDVNVPSKAFGELVQALCHTPSLPAEEVKALLERGEDVVVVDARRFDEYHTMSIPTAISVPGAELALRVPALAPDPRTRVIVNCAGRTRSLIGAQSLINAGLPNPVAALRNGTIGWTLAGLRLDQGQTRRCPAVDEDLRAIAAQAARRLADRAGVQRAVPGEVDHWLVQRGRTTYFFDVRTPEEYDAGHPFGFRSAPGGQLVQETEMFVPVRGARIVLADRDGVRANMTSSWLAQMGWEVFVVDGLVDADFREHGSWRAPLPPLPAVRTVDVETLADWQAIAGEVVVVDVDTGTAYRRAHIPGAWFALRSQFDQAAARLPGARRYVITSRDGLLARYALADLQRWVEAPVLLLAGGTEAWIGAGLPTEGGAVRLASELIDRYSRPYEGTDNPHEAMQAYLDWEFGLVEQLRRDGTHGFRVLT